VTLKPGLGVTEGHWNDKYRSTTYDFLLTFHSKKYEPISYRFQDKRLFQSKITTFPHPVYFVAQLKGSPWNWVPVLGVKKLEWWGYQAQKEGWRYLQPSGYNAPTWQTDGLNMKQHGNETCSSECLFRLNVNKLINLCQGSPFSIHSRSIVLCILVSYSLFHCNLTPLTFETVSPTATVTFRITCI